MNKKKQQGSSVVAPLDRLDKAAREKLRKEVLESVPRIEAAQFASFSAVKSEKYLSEWNDNVVVLDVSASRNFNKTLRVNLDEIWVNCEGGLSIFQGVVPLTTFPNLANTVKAFLNDCINTFGNSTDVVSEIHLNFNNLVRFIIWMFRRKGIYQFARLTRPDFEDFAADFRSNHGWAGVLGYEEALADVVKQLKNGELDPDEVLSPYQTAHPYLKRVQFKQGAIEKLTGLPITRTEVPESFREEVAKITAREFKCQVSSKDGVSKMSAYAVFKALNRLYRLPETFDRPRIKPVPNALALAKKNATMQHEERTKNLRLEDAIALFNESVRWIYDYAPHILPLLNKYREILEHYSNLSNAWASRKVNEDEELKQYITKTLEASPIPFRGIVNGRRAPDYDERHCPSITDLIQHMMTACFIMIATNHGRRLNEIIGVNQLPYGLYFGCIHEKSESPARYIDIYIEKTVKDWCSFYVNQLVIDAVKLLEEISQVFRPLFTPRKTYKDDINAARHDKLFVWHYLTPLGFEYVPISYNFRAASTKFYRRAGVTDLDLDHRAHPFRRFFALLYFYRYDNPKLLALQHHLWHLDPGMTVVYISDPPMRREADRIEVLYRKRVEQHTKEEMALLNDVRSEMFHDTVDEILQGKRNGGNWPKIVTGLYRILANRGTFDGKSLHEQAELTAKGLEKRGYGRIPFENGGCNNGDNRLTRKKSACHSEDDDFSHLEDASPVKCHQCIHHDSGETNIHFMEAERRRMRDQTLDYGLPVYVRKAAEREFSLLDKVIDSEEKLSLENRRFLSTVVDTFALTHAEVPHG